jgi:NADPH-dependent glutamate synthase beta subunit-like oxidoreductase
MGYRPTIFEAASEPGGMLVQAIPAYRLPRDILRREIGMIEKLGVHIKTNKALGRDFTLSSLKETGCEAVFLAVGAPKGTGLGLAVTYGIVKMHRGDIRVKSNADPAAGPTGTTFTVTIPRQGRPE